MHCQVRQIRIAGVQNSTSYTGTRWKNVTPKEKSRCVKPVYTTHESQKVRKRERLNCGKRGTLTIWSLEGQDIKTKCDYLSIMMSYNAISKPNISPAIGRYITTANWCFQQKTIFATNISYVLLVEEWVRKMRRNCWSQFSFSVAWSLEVIFEPFLMLAFCITKFVFST